MNRSIKRFTIIGIFGVILITFISLIVSLAIPNPTCSDGKQNQKEEGIDCGGPCKACSEELVGKDLIVKNTYVVYGGENKYDVVADIHNPNALYGGREVYYTLEIVDTSGNVLATRDSKTFILPNENKYIVEVGMETQGKPSSVKISINNVDWVKFTEFDSPQILVKNQRFGLVENSTSYAEAFGLVVNDSPYDFQNVVVNVILEDERGVPIAVNKTEMRTLDANSQREFRLVWPHKFPGNIKTTKMRAQTNIFDSLNFMKKYLPGGHYQDLL
jgi:hypothetical protein